MGYEEWFFISWIREALDFVKTKRCKNLFFLLEIFKKLFTNGSF